MQAHMLRGQLNREGFDVGPAPCTLTKRMRIEALYGKRNAASAGMVRTLEKPSVRRAPLEIGEIRAAGFACV
jgi:hypothetical protein